jgi:hypothetical protein
MVTNNGLIKDMANVPLGVARLMCIRQWEAVGEIEVSVFQQHLRAAAVDGGFNWSATPEWEISDWWWAHTLHDSDWEYILLAYRNDICVFPDNATLKGCE